MPRRRTPVPPTAYGEDGVELAHLPAPVEKTATEQRRDDDLEALLQELGDDTRLQIYNEGKYAGTLPGHGVTLDTILEQFGGGEKSIVVWQGRERREAIKLSFDPAIPPTSPSQRKAEERNAKQAPGTEATGMVNLMAAMAQSQLTNMQTMTAMMSGMTTALTQVLAAGASKKDPVDMALALAAALKPSPDASTNPFEAMKFGIDLAGKLGPREDDDTMTAIREGLGVLGKAIDAHRETAARAPVVASPPMLPAESGDSAVAPASPLVPAPPAPATVAPLATDRPWYREAAPYVDSLVRFAHLLPARAAAVTLNERMTEAGFDDLIADVQHDTPQGFAERLLQRFPQVAAVGGLYLETLIGAMLEAADDGEDMEDDDATGAVPPTIPVVMP